MSVGSVRADLHVIDHTFIEQSIQAYHGYWPWNSISIYLLFSFSSDKGLKNQQAARSVNESIE